MDRFDAMAVLVAVVEEGSLSAGARRMRTPLATVSRKIADLERHLRARLLVRTSRHLELTDAGRAFLVSARRILDQVEEAESAAAGEYLTPRGQLTIASSVDLGNRLLAPMVAEFLEMHPKIQVSLMLTDRIVHLVEERVDVAIQIGDVDGTNLVTSRVGDIGLVTSASPAYLERTGTPEHPTELEQRDCIVITGGAPSTWSSWRFRDGQAPLLVDPRPRMRVSCISPAVDAAVAGLGLIQTLSCQVKDQLADGRLVPVLEEFAPSPLDARIVYPSREMMPLKTRAFIDFVAPRLRVRLSREQTSGSALYRTPAIPNVVAANTNMSMVAA
jgi:DNA-binding transcriptional LysR family regulator